MIPRRWKVIQTVRERFACRACEAMTQPPAPFHATPRGLFGPSLLAMTMFEKFGTHQPLNRQRDRYAREGVELSLSTLADQVGACAAALRPLHLLTEAHVLAAERLHGDDTTVPVLAKIKTDIRRCGPMCAMTARSQGQHRQPPCSATRAIAAPSIPSVTSPAMAASCRPTPMLATRAVRADRLPAPLTRALCWAHARRKFFELADVAAQLKRRQGAPVISPIAAEAVRRIDTIFDAERAVSGRTAPERLAMRREIAAPLVAELEQQLRS